MKTILLSLLLLTLQAQAFVPSLTSSVKTVTTAGTEERLATTSTKYHMIVLQAECDNTNNVYIGGSGVSSANGITLDACETFTFSANTIRGTNITFDLYNIWVDVDTNGEGVKILGIRNE